MILEVKPSYDPVCFQIQPSSVGRFGCIFFFKGGKFHFHAPVRALFLKILFTLCSRFGDCTERWSSFFELRRLGDPAPSEGAPLPPPPPSLPPPPSKSRIELLREQIKTEAEELPGHVLEARGQLSYSFDCLVWDSSHQRNESETYCYCGESGDWYKKMLQCKDCLQWFHQECIRSLTYQLLCGDR